MTIAYLGDVHGQWQAMEGMGAVFFNQGQVNRAIKYFKLALSTLVTAEQNSTAQERILAKLTDAMQCQVNGSEQTEVAPTTPDVQILVNDIPRPPTRQEQLIMKSLRSGQDIMLI